jgi:hypothetical protein
MKFGKVGNSFSTSGTNLINLVINPVLNHALGTGRVYDKWNMSVVNCDTNIP